MMPAPRTRTFIDAERTEAQGVSQSPLSLVNDRADGRRASQ